MVADLFNCIDCTARGKQKKGWQRCDAVVIQPDWSLVSAKTAAILPCLAAASARSMRLFRRWLWCSLARRLALLQLFLLSGMLLLDLLRLLSVALFHLLFLRVVVVFRSRLLMFFFLLLLELLMILRLLGS